MTLYVIDASVAAAWFVRQQATAATDALLTTVGAHEWIAPDCIRFEVGNVLLRQERRGALPQGSAELLLERLERRLKVAFLPPPPRTIFKAAVKLARDHRLSLFDGLYLQLAAEREAVLATRDGLLVAAAVQEGCHVLDARTGA